MIAAFTDTLREDLPRDEYGAVTGDDPFGAQRDLFPLAAAADFDSDGDPFGDLDAAADPFGGGGGGAGFGAAALLNRRATVRQFYRKLGDTEELAETHYYQLKIADQIAERVPVNSFWRDFATWDGEGDFLSPHFPEASNNFTEIMLALAVLDLPFSSDPPELAQRGNELTVTAKGAAIVFAEQTQKAALEVGDVVIGQKFYPLAQPTSLDRGERVPNYIDANFVIGTGYGSHVVATNPTGRHLHFDLLRQLPHGAIPLNGSRMTHNTSVDLAPYSTQTFTMGFYFPMAGKFAQYPVQASGEEHVIASTPSKTFTVTRESGEIDVTSWDDLATRGSDAAVLAFLQGENLNHYPLDKIAWRMKDKQFFSDVIAILRDRQTYHHGLYAFGLLHDHLHATQQFLLNSGLFLDEIGGVIESELLTVSPSGRRLYQHLEYEPLINARRHRLGDESRIVNGQFKGQYERLLRLLTHKASPDDEDRLSLVYYLLLQERIDEAAAAFDQIDVTILATQLQYDYFGCYLGFYREQVAQAREIALKYTDHPVDRWRQLFAQVVSQADEIGGVATVEVDDPARP